MMVTRISDLLTGKKVQDYYKIYDKTQWYDEEQMKAFQLRKLQKLIEHCYFNVPYYQKFMKSYGIRPNDVVNLKTIQLFPIITKEIIKENYTDFIPINISRIKGVKTSQTGGTTGNILFKRNDANTRSSVWATYNRFYDWMGIKNFDKTLILMGGHVIGKNFNDYLKKTINHILTNSTSFNPYDTSTKNINAIEMSLANNSFALIRSYSQFLYYVANRLNERNIRIKVKAITTTAEPLMEEHRTLFRDVFNSETFDQYGCGEIGGIAYECEYHQGLHIAEERVILETNENNELIITDLDNFAMPFIRYWNADQAIISDRRCSCGRPSKVIKEVLGRTCDYIIGLNGEFLHWAYFWHLLFDSKIAKNKNLKKFQIVQHTTNVLIIRLSCERLSSEEMKLIESNIQSRLGNMKIAFSFEEEIENSPSGKYRPVINKLLLS